MKSLIKLSSQVSRQVSSKRNNKQAKKTQLHIQHLNSIAMTVADSPKEKVSPKKKKRTKKNLEKKSYLRGIFTWLVPYLVITCEIFSSGNKSTRVCPGSLPFSSALASQPGPPARARARSHIFTLACGPRAAGPPYPRPAGRPDLAILPIYRPSSLVIMRCTQVFSLSFRFFACDHALVRF